jgi:hypothetical protein
MTKKLKIKVNIIKREDAIIKIAQDIIEAEDDLQSYVYDLLIGEAQPITKWSDEDIIDHYEYVHDEIIKLKD